ncbi:MAG: polysaccharide biosynthesis/export family protein [Halioglobus sp.]
MNTYKRSALYRAITLLLFVVLSACTSTQKPYDIAAEPTIIKSLSRYTRTYVIAPGDQLEVAVYRNADVSRTVVVRPDGAISLPLLDEIPAAGLTPQELDNEITGRLAGRLKTPEVTVIVTNPLEPMVYVYGEVGLVRPVPLREARTMAQAIAHAGGMTRDAAQRDVALIRLDTDGYIKMHLLKDMADGPVGPYAAFQNTALKPDDLIIVPESKRSMGGRIINDFVVEPLGALNLMLTPWFQYRLIDDLQ